jgi:DNA gyrase subunit A
MSISRPDLTRVSPEVAAYIEALETELAQLRAAGHPTTRGVSTRGSTFIAANETEEPPIPAEPSEPPTTLNVITISAGGRVKRTPRHLYYRQRRGGMGVFDMENVDGDGPAFLTIADVAQGLVLLTDLGRAFRIPVVDLPETPLNSRGQPLGNRLPLIAGEKLAVIFPDSGGTYLTMVTQRGQVRRMRHHYFGPSLVPGTQMHDVREGGAPAAACWSDGDGELFIVTGKGDGIRFAERQVPVRGCLGIRVDPDDAVTGAVPVKLDGGVFLLGNDGKGTIRLMAGFTANKGPGSGGKTAFKAERVVAAMPAGADDDLFIISQLGKIIRFRADEVPAKEGVVQGVNCMALRNDETTAAVNGR